MRLTPTDGFKMLNKAYENKTDKILWDMWLAKYPWMDEKNFINFEDFKNVLLKQSNESKGPQKTKEEIISQSEKIIKAWKGGKPNNGNI